MRKLIPILLSLILLLCACGQDPTGTPPGQTSGTQSAITQPPQSDEEAETPSISGQDIGAMVEEDFAYLYEALLANYPYANVIDEAAWNDEVQALSEHMQDMGFGYNAYQQNVGIALMNTVPVRVNMATIWLTEYEQMQDGEGMSQPELVQQLAKQPLTIAFYQGIAQEYGEVEEESSSAPSRIETALLLDGSAGYVRIPRFGGEDGDAQDRAQLMEFYNSLGDASSLIIDIRGNPGDCADTKWKELLIAPLIANSSISTARTLVSGGEVASAFNNSFAPYANNTYTEIAAADITGLDESALQNTAYVREITTTIEPAPDSIAFAGSIYLLTNSANLGQMDAFAQHAADSGFATLIGQQTAGQGIGFDNAVYITLPASGLLVRFNAESGLNPDGSLNLSGGIIPAINTGAADALAACITGIDPTANAVEIARSVIPMNPIVTIEMDNGGIITAELYPDVAPNTVANFVSLIQQGFYDGTIFHRVIPGFMIQGGDPDGTGMGGPDYAIKGEFAMNGFQNSLAHERGVLSMARSQMPDSAGSQFFIMHAAATHLDGQYAAFGRVTDGMDVVDAIAALPTGANDRPENPPVMKKVTVETGGIEYTLEKLPSLR